MSKYVISYNPYQNRTIVEKDGSKLLENCDFCQGLKGKRLQNWFDVTSNWPGIGKAIDEDNNESKCEILFRGREIDYLDLKEYFSFIYKSERGTEFQLAAEHLSSDEDMLARVSDLIKEAKEKKLFPDKQIRDLEEHLKRLKDEPFVISVIATMSSGKSTLLNAFLRKELLPTGDPGTTANIVEIYDNDREAAVYETFDASKKLISKGDNADLETLQRINSDKRVRTVKIHTDIPMVSTGRLSLMLRDTPGPNNAGDKRHEEITNSVISNARDMSTVLYIINAQHLEVKDDENLLKMIAKSIREGGKQANDRFLFVVNRVDAWSSNKKQTLEDLLSQVKSYLKRFEIDDPRIFPVTASLASDIWCSRNGCELSREERYFEADIELFGGEKNPKFALDQFASTTVLVKRELEEELRRARNNCDQYELALIHSGVKGLEYSIREYIEKYAYPIKISEVVEDISDSIDEKKMRDYFKELIGSDEHKLEAVQVRLNEIENKKKEREGKEKEFERSINSYNISGESREKARDLANIAFKELLEKYTSQIRNQSRLKQEDAERISGELQLGCSKAEKWLADMLDEMIQKEVYEKGNEILKKYHSYIRRMEEEIAIEGFDFRKVKDLKRSEFDSIREVADKVTATEQLYTSRQTTVKNPKYRKFLFLHWGGPEYTTKTEKVEAGVIHYVDREKFTNEVIGIRVKVERNVDSVLQDAADLVKTFKSFFSRELRKFHATIDTVAEELRKETTFQTKASFDKQEHEKQKEELERYLNKLHAVTEF